ncbi:MAG TPA: TadE/TadG family type IV pilus assembly protein [Alphaproteobacteria bacterium]|nr:TadE/TadG family type IV pilus assembly protein [Alphaproteobacteria bacterium]
MKGWIAALRVCWGCSRAAAALEFGIIAPVFILILVAVMEFGRLHWVRNSIEYAAEQTARWAMVNTTATDSQLRAKALEQFDSVAAGAADVVIDRDAVNGLNFLTVTVTYDFDFLVDFTGTGTLPLRGEARVPLI